MSRELDILVTGSISLHDHIVMVDEIPKKGGVGLLTENLDRVCQTYFGGCASTIALAAARLGLRAGVLGVVGADFESSGYKAHLEENGVCLEGVFQIADEQSDHCFMVYDQHQDAVIVSTVNLWPRINQVDLSLDLVTRSAAVVIAPCEPDYAVRVASLANSSGISVIQSGRQVEREAELLKRCKIAILNEFETNDLCAAAGISEPVQLLDEGPSLLFVTRGGRGSDVYTRDARLNIPALKLEQVEDPTGAGDAYAAGVVAALAREQPSEVAARVGSVLASFALEARGAQTALPSWEQMSARYFNVFQESLQKVLP